MKDRFAPMCVPLPEMESKCEPMPTGVTELGNLLIQISESIARKHGIKASTPPEGAASPVDESKSAT